jgi:pimeloyl-ACP methyl ester carboxylesterase
MAVDTVVFVPGICGSVLKLGDEEIWPGTPWNVAFRNYPDRYVDLLATSKEVRATDVLRSVPLKLLGVALHHFDGYGRALTALEGMGFHEGGGTLVPFGYDWRMDVRTSAEALKARLARPDFAGRRVAIVAHSMGGLVTRYMIEILGPPISVRVELCVLVAVPHLGAPVALQNLLGLRPEIFLSGPQCKAALRNADFPSAYQLLPREGVPALLAASSATGFEVEDLFGVAAARYGLVAGSIQAARGLGAELQYMGPGFRPPCRYVAIAGNAQKTVTANYLDPQVDKARPVEEPTAGDGTVPLWSAAPPGIPVRYVAATHAGVFADPDTVAMLVAVLTPGRPGARLFSTEARAGLAVLSSHALHTSVEGGQSFTIAIVADKPTDSIEAVLEVEQLFEGGRTETQEVPIRYKGGFLRSIPLDFTAPTERAVLRFRVRQAGVPVAGTETTVLALGTTD